MVVVWLLLAVITASDQRAGESAVERGRHYKLDKLYRHEDWIIMKCYYSIKVLLIGM